MKIPKIKKGYGENIEYTLQINVYDDGTEINYYGEDNTLLSIEVTEKKLLQYLTMYNQVKDLS